MADWEAGEAVVVHLMENLHCFVLVMGGDYLAMQKDWMNAPPQIACTLSILCTSLRLSLFRCVLFILHS